MSTDFRDPILKLEKGSFHKLPNYQKYKIVKMQPMLLFHFLESKKCVNRDRQLLIYGAIKSGGKAMFNYLTDEQIIEGMNCFGYYHDISSTKHTNRFYELFGVCISNLNFQLKSIRANPEFFDWICSDECQEQSTIELYLKLNPRNIDNRNIDEDDLSSSCIF